MNNNSVSMFVGLDYHLNSVQVCTMDCQGTILSNRNCANDWQAIAQSVHRHGTTVRAAIESCAGAANLAEQLVSLAGWSVHMAHPGYVRRMKQNPDKTDYSDARMLADLERVGYLPRVWMAPESVRELRKMVRYRQQLVAERKNVKLRLTAILREHRLFAPSDVGGRWSRRWLKWLRETDGLGPSSRWIADRHLERLQSVASEVKAAEERLTQLTQHDPMVLRLQEHDSIGPVTSWVMRAMIGRFDRFRSGKQLAHFCGISPCNTSSGEKQADSGMIKAGDGLLRSTLIEAGHRLIRHVERWRTLAARLQANGKKPCEIIGAVVNRWMRWLFHQMKEVPMNLPA